MPGKNKDKLKFSMLTWNTANLGITRRQAYLLNEKLLKPDPDVIFVGLQEHSSNNKGEYFYQGNFCDYNKVASSSFKVITKPRKLSSFQAMSVYTKKDIKVKQLAQGSYTDDLMRNKGGQYNILKIEGVVYAFLNVHLDSYDRKKRNNEMFQLRKKIRQDHPYIDEIIILGDFNERIVDHDNREKNPFNIPKQVPYAEGFSKAHSKATYEQHEGKFNNKRKAYDKGSLDQVFTVSQIKYEKDKTVVKKAKTDYKHDSDHNPVFREFTLDTKKILYKKSNLTTDRLRNLLENTSACGTNYRGGQSITYDSTVYTVPYGIYSTLKKMDLLVDTSIFQKTKIDNNKLKSLEADEFTRKFKKNIKDYAKDHTSRGGVFRKRNLATAVMYRYFSEEDAGEKVDRVFCKSPV